MKKYQQIQQKNEPTPQTCHICQKCPQQILILNCKHNICLQCSDFLYKKFVGKQNIINCVVCGQKTFLDNQTIQHISRSVKISHQNQHNIKQHQKKDVLTQTIDLFSAKEGNHNIAKQVLVQTFPKKRECNDHCQDEMTYICFTCGFQLICPECYINGPHENHQISSIKKYLPTIKNALFHKNQELSAVQKKLNSFYNNQKQKIEIRKLKVQQLKKSAIQKFKQLKKSIEQEQKIILNKFDTILVKYQRQQYQNNKKSQQQNIDFEKTLNDIKALNQKLQNTKSNQKNKHPSLFNQFKILLNNIQSKMQSYANLEKNQETFENQQINKNKNQIQTQDIQIEKLTNRVQKIAGKVGKFNPLQEIQQNNKNTQLDKNFFNKSPIQTLKNSLKINNRNNLKQNQIILPSKMHPHQQKQIIYSRKMTQEVSVSQKYYNYLGSYQLKMM